MDDFTGLRKQAIAGDANAQTALVERYSGLLSRILSRVQNLRHEEREELLQDVFLSLFDHALGDFHGSTEHEFRAYLRSIAENKAKSLLRRHSRRFEIAGLLQPTDEYPVDGRSADPYDPADPTPGPEQNTLAQEALEQLQGCLAAIPLVDQEIFWMRQRGAPYAEIRKTLGLRMGTVASKFNRTKAKIEACLRAAGIL